MPDVACVADMLASLLGLDLGAPAFLGFLWGLDFSSNDQQTQQNTDQSQSYSLADQSSGSRIGSALYLAGSDNAQVTLTDAGAIQALKENSLRALDNMGQTVQRVADSAQLAVRGALELADKSRQTDTQTVFGTVGRAIPWLAGAVAVVAALLGAAYLWRKR